jgi:hypothetical protein
MFGNRYRVTSKGLLSNDCRCRKLSFLAVVRAHGLPMLVAPMRCTSYLK